MDFLLVLLTLYLSLALHEWGHLVFLRRMGVPVPLFALGGPPWILRFRRGGTEYRLGLLLFGAFVQADTAAFARLPLGRAAAVYLAGPLFSLLGALASGLLLTFYKPDALLRILGVMIALPGAMVEGLQAVFTGTAQAGEVGFRALFAQGGHLLSQGLPGFLSLFAGLNLALGVFNLLPIPPLDGGQVWARALERWSWGRKVALGATLLGLGFLVALFALTLLYDFGLMGRG